MNPPTTNALPTVTLMVAMRNEEKQVAKCLRTLFAQDYPDEHLEVFISDGCSTDASCDIVKDLIKGKPNYRLIGFQPI